jgi:hypothetical protein
VPSCTALQMGMRSVLEAKHSGDILLLFSLKKLHKIFNVYLLTLTHVSPKVSKFYLKDTNYYYCCYSLCLTSQKWLVMKGNDFGFLLIFHSQKSVRNIQTY